MEESSGEKFKSEQEAAEKLLNNPDALYKGQSEENPEISQKEAEDIILKGIIESKKKEKLESLLERIHNSDFNGFKKIFEEYVSLSYYLGDVKELREFIEEIKKQMDKSGLFRDERGKKYKNIRDELDELGKKRETKGLLKEILKEIEEDENVEERKTIFSRFKSLFYEKYKKQIKIIGGIVGAAALLFLGATAYNIRTSYQISRTESGTMRSDLNKAIEANSKNSKEINSIKRILAEGPKTPEEEKLIDYLRSYFQKTGEYQLAGNYVTDENLKSLLEGYLTSNEVNQKISDFETATNTKIWNMNLRVYTLERTVKTDYLYFQLGQLIRSKKTIEANLKNLEAKINSKEDPTSIQNQINNLNTQQAEYNKRLTDYEDRLGKLEKGTEDYKTLEQGHDKLKRDYDESQKQYTKDMKDLDKKKQDKPKKFLGIIPTK